MDILAKVAIALVVVAVALLIIGVYIENNR